MQFSYNTSYAYAYCLRPVRLWRDTPRDQTLKEVRPHQPYITRSADDSQNLTKLYS